MNQNFKNYVDDLNFMCQKKVNEIKYSKEYLDLKDSIVTTADTTKKLFMEDLKTNGVCFGRLVKKAVQKKSFTQLLRAK